MTKKCIVIVLGSILGSISAFAASYSNISATASLWQETVKLTAPSGRTSDVRTTFYVAGLQFRKNISGAYFNYRLEGGGFSGAVDSQIVDSSVVSYSNRGAEVSGGDFIFSIYKSFSKGQSQLGFALPVVYRKAFWDSSMSGYQISDEYKILYSAALEMSWRLSSHVTVLQRIGTGPALSGALWQAMIGWDGI